MSDSVRPHGQQPTRLPRPWDSPGKDTEVGCHFLLQCMKVKSENEATQSCPTLSNCMDYSPLGPSVHGIFQARILEWVAIAFSNLAVAYSTKHNFIQFQQYNEIEITMQFRISLKGPKSHLLSLKVPACLT